MRYICADTKQRWREKKDHRIRVKLSTATPSIYFHWTILHTAHRTTSRLSLYSAYMNHVHWNVYTRMLSLYTEKMSLCFYKTIIIITIINIIIIATHEKRKGNTLCGVWMWCCTHEWCVWSSNVLNTDLRVGFSSLFPLFGVRTRIVYMFMLTYIQCVYVSMYMDAHIYIQTRQTYKETRIDLCVYKVSSTRVAFALPCLAVSLVVS